jgi:hypothetical protein
MNNHKITHAPVGFADIATCSDSFFLSVLFFQVKVAATTVVAVVSCARVEPSQAPFFLPR